MTASHALRYDPSATLRLLESEHLDSAYERLALATDEVTDDLQLFNSNRTIPSEKLPLDAGFIELPAELLTEAEQAGANSQIARIEATARRLQDEVDRVVVLGIGGSYMGARALFEALRDPHHNERDRAARNGIPRLYFEGNNVDSDALRSLLSLLPSATAGDRTVDNRWATVVISKSGGTLETALAFRLFRQALEACCGTGSEELKRLIVPVTGETGKLRNITNEQQYVSHFPIPDGVGGRFSIFTAVGLLPAAVLGLDIRALLQGAADMTERFRSAARGDNPVLDYTAICHACEQRGMTTRLLSTWGSRMEAAGFWYDQLLSESLGKHERGATPITVVNTRDLHSRGQQHQEGARDKIITNVIVEQSSATPLSVPRCDSDLDGLNQFADKTVADVLNAAIRGTNEAYADDHRPTADLILPVLNEYVLGQFFQMLMLATVLEGRLVGTNPYGQPGVEAYKKNTMRILAE